MSPEPCIQKDVNLASIPNVIARIYRDVLKHETMESAAALSYYSILAIFPGLIVLSALMAYIPLPDLFADVLVSMGRVLPPETMHLVYSVFPDVLSANRQAWLSLGMLGTIWVVSAVFDAAIGALDTAYEVKVHRPIWKTRLLAVGLSCVTGFLLVCALAVLIIGPRFGEWLANRLSLSWLFFLLWPLIHRTIAVAFTVLAVQAIYFFGPNAKHGFRATLPGALFSVAFWITLSFLLESYFRHFTSYNRTYGTLVGFIAFMIWFYWAAFALLVGAELNNELVKMKQPSGPKPQMI